MEKKSGTPLFSHVTDPDDKVSAFGGCVDSLSQYKIIGHALLAVEQESFVYGYGSQRAIQEFRVRVASVCVEILESYLEDLLDPRVGLELLYVARTGLWRSIDLLTGFSLLGSCVVGGYISYISGAPLVGLSSTFLLILPVIAVWHRSPLGNMARRVAFARIVSKEVGRRRGGGDREVSSNVVGGARAFSLRNFLGAEPENVTSSAPVRRIKIN